MRSETSMYATGDQVRVQGSILRDTGTIKYFSDTRFGEQALIEWDNADKPSEWVLVPRLRRAELEF